MNDFNINQVPAADTSAAAILCNEDSLPAIPHKSFEGSYLQTALHFEGDTPRLYVGVGALDDITPLEIKELGAKISKAFKAEKIFDFSIQHGPLTADDNYFRNIVQGLILGVYQYSLKTKDAPEDTQWNVSLVGEEDHSAAVEEGLILAQSVVFARDAINAPVNHLRPADFAQRIQEFLSPVGIEVEITAGDDLKAMGMNGLYSVGNSSDFPPQLVVMRYNGANGGKKTALVGKGLMYDTGGYSLKTNMTTMEGDMAGSAAVVGALYALAKNKIKTDVVGIVVLAENRLSNSALVPGDVYTAYDGQTVEVLNTDAEGRLVLADGVAYAVITEKADQVVDIATLTGAVGVALSHGVAGTVTNDDATFDELVKASKSSGERYWNFPTHREYHKMIDSDVADVKNIGGTSGGGTITGGLFIGRFVDEKPWIHLDIAGTSWMNTPLFEFQNTGGTGTSVDTLYYFCKNKGK